MGAVREGRREQASRKNTEDQIWSLWTREAPSVLVNVDHNLSVHLVQHTQVTSTWLIVDILIRLMNQRCCYSSVHTWVCTEHDQVNTCKTPLTYTFSLCLWVLRTFPTVTAEGTCALVMAVKVSDLFSPPFFLLGSEGQLQHHEHDY